MSFADEAATSSHIAAADVAGAEIQHANWNSCWRWGNPTPLKDANGASTDVTMKWDATGAWVVAAAPLAGGNGILMNGYLDSNGQANGAFDGVFGSANDKPIVLVTKLDEWMAENNLTSYSVVIYADGDSAGGDRATRVWLANTLPGAPVGADPGLGTDLTSRVDIIDQSNWNTNPTFTRVTGTSGVGNYTVFSGLTAPAFYIRVDEAGTGPWRAPLNGFQIIGTNVVEVPDTDDDGLPDAWENNHGLDPEDDGTTNIDNGPEGNPDNDGRTNLEEFNEGVDSTNPRKADTDEDGLDDGEEFTAGTLPLDPDTDNDTLPDGWEVDNELNPLDDGTTDPDNGANGDPDEDLLLNSGEYTRKTDAQLADTDDDGYNDVDEDGGGTWSSEFLTGSSAIKADTDGDGIKDGDENPDEDYAAGTVTGTDPNKSDTDGDGQNDRWEFLLGTDPKLDSSTLPTVPVVNSSFELPDAAGGFLRVIPDSWSLSTAHTIEETYVECLTGSGVSGGQGAQYAGIQTLGNYLYQDTGVAFSPNTTYLVDLAGGYRNGFPTGTVEFGLYSSSAIGTPVSGYPGRMDLNGVRLESGNPDADGVVNKLRDASALTTIGSGALGRPYSFVTGSTPPAGNIAVYIRHASGFRVLFDNVRIIAVPNATDVDTDGLPDGWELANNLSPRDNGSIAVVNGAAGDRDIDESPNSQELAAGSDPNDLDTDGDGLSDGVESNSGDFIDADDTGTSPIKMDSDGDQIADNTELTLGTDPTLPDTDGDGFNDNVEVAAGTDPTDEDDFPITADPKVTAFSFNGAAFELTVGNLVAAKTYTLARSTTLDDFSPIGTTVTGVTTHTFSDADTPEGAAFYRVEEVTGP
ncbi:hypothetical protein [Luteolibacter arcticus]|uniref:hypothetical protein n=1 Tax=Luteolibacter arcticus TaxID=1581411 RepID=UPI0022228DF2|nr:hypothetical protein [Luteolibacter arcticus]